METIARLPVRNTANLINEHSRFCGLVWAPPKTGKTTLGATLDKMTRRFFDKPTLFIACEAGEGGGTASIREAGVDYVMPSSKDELDAIIAWLKTDTKYGGVVEDSSTETVKRFYQPYALKFPNIRDKDAAATRAAGVPAQSDYQTMGEVVRSHFNELIGLTVLNKADGTPDNDRRKHVLVTALERTREDRKSGEIISIGPDLPGAMANTATAMFQIVMNLQIREQVQSVAGKVVRSYERVLVTEADGKRILGDRFKVFPAVCKPDLEFIWENYWVPKIQATAMTTLPRT